MPQLQICTYYDRKSNRFDTPFVTANLINAERKFQMDIQNPDSLLNKFKNDFELHHLCIFYVDTGEMDVVNEVIAEGKDIKMEEK